MSIYHSPEIDGPIEKFISLHEEEGTPPCFRGVYPYYELWDRGWVEPEITSIRLMMGDGRSDEHYLVLDKDQLEGIQLAFHSGRSNSYNPRNLLPTAPYWEIDGLNLDPENVIKE
jgi:hypothetical protein